MATQPLRRIEQLHEISGNASFNAGNGLVTLAFDTDARVLVPAEIDLSGLASEAYVNAAIAALVDTAPGALDTLNELAAALGDDANFASTVTTALASKMTETQGDARYLQLTGGTLTGALNINLGTSQIRLDNWGGAPNFAALWLNGAAPSNENYSVLAGGDDTYINGKNTIYFRVNNTGIPGVVSQLMSIASTGANSHGQHRFSHTGHASDATLGAMILGKASSAPLATNDFLRLNEYNSDTALFRVDKAGNILLNQFASLRIGDATGFGTVAAEVTAGANVFPAVFKGNNIGVLVRVPTYEEGRGMLTLYGNDKSLRIDANTKMEWAAAVESGGTFDTNLYRSAANILATDDDFELKTATKGVILTDRTTATRYRLKVDSGTLSIEAV